jgi:hypothetical protein
MPLFIRALSTRPLGRPARVALTDLEFGTELTRDLSTPAGLTFKDAKAFVARAEKGVYNAHPYILVDRSDHVAIFYAARNDLPATRRYRPYRKADEDGPQTVEIARVYRDRWVLFIPTENLFYRNGANLWNRLTPAKIHWPRVDFGYAGGGTRPAFAGAPYLAARTPGRAGRGSVPSNWLLWELPVPKGPDWVLHLEVDKHGVLLDGFWDGPD